jgi:hypothetical protein
MHLPFYKQNNLIKGPLHSQSCQIISKQTNTNLNVLEHTFILQLSTLDVVVLHGSFHLTPLTFEMLSATLRAVLMNL